MQTGKRRRTSKLGEGGDGGGAVEGGTQDAKKCKLVHRSQSECRLKICAPLCRLLHPSLHRMVISDKIPPRQLQPDPVGTLEYSRIHCFLD